MTELEKLQEWFEAEKAKGLLDVKILLSFPFFQKIADTWRMGESPMEVEGDKVCIREDNVRAVVNSGKLEQQIEEFAKEMNEMIAAPVVEDREIF